MILGQVAFKDVSLFSQQALNVHRPGSEIGAISLFSSEHTELRRTCLYGFKLGFQLINQY